ncbi:MULTISPECIES: lipoprotein [Halomonadaceae]|uniref:LPS translocon maturation chaperone LptM n=1 Tax=Halomonas sp. BMC7 TaxID=2920520 RepID=UPI0015840420|nr:MULTISPECIES: lipoprotein [Halomonas]MDI4636555.1 lipoprotein [Halomonas sp. BMC7]NUJ60920.1 lipoprotein [Halomonas taeanensis]
MKVVTRTLPMIVLAALLLAGCGQKGPLYMPADSQGDNAAVVSKAASEQPGKTANGDTNDQTGESTPADTAPDAPEDES